MAAILVECVNDTVCYVFRGLKNCTNNSASSIIHAFVPLMNGPTFCTLETKSKNNMCYKEKYIRMAQYNNEGMHYRH